MGVGNGQVAGGGHGSGGRPAVVPMLPLRSASSGYHSDVGPSTTSHSLYPSSYAAMGSSSGATTPRTDTSLRDYFSDDDWQTPFLAYSYTFRAKPSAHIKLSAEERERSDLMRTLALKEDYLREKRIQRRLRQLQKTQERDRREKIEKLVEKSKWLVQKQKEKNEAIAARRIRIRELEIQKGRLSIDAALDAPGSPVAASPNAAAGGEGSGATPGMPLSPMQADRTPASPLGSANADKQNRTPGKRLLLTPGSNAGSNVTGGSAVDRKRMAYALQWQRQERLQREQAELQAEETRKKAVLQKRERSLRADRDAKKLLKNPKLETRVEKTRQVWEARVAAADERSPLKKFQSDNQRYLSPTKGSSQNSSQIQNSLGAADGQAGTAAVSAEPQGPTEAQKTALAYIEEGSEMLLYAKPNSAKSHKRFFRVSVATGLIAWADKKTAKRFKQALITGVQPKVDVPIAANLMSKSFTIKNNGGDGDLMVTVQDDEAFFNWIEGLDYVITSRQNQSLSNIAVVGNGAGGHASGAGESPSHGADASTRDGFHSESGEDGVVLSQQEREHMLLSFVTEGSQMMKYTKGGKGKPHSRYFKVEVPRGQIKWADTKMSKQWRKAKMVGILRGFGRKVEIDGVTPDIERRAFTVKCADGEDVYVVAPTIDVVARWIDAIQLVCEKQDSERSTLTFADRAMRALWGAGGAGGAGDDAASTSTGGSGDTVAESVYAGSAVGKGGGGGGGEAGFLRPRTQSDASPEFITVCDGAYLSKYTKGGKGKPHPRFFSAKMPEGLLCWGDTKGAKRVRKGVMIAVLPCSNTSSSEVTEAENRPLSLIVKCAGKMGDIILLCSSHTERDAWVKGLQVAIRNADRTKSATPEKPKHKKQGSFDSDAPTELDGGARAANLEDLMGGDDDPGLDDLDDAEAMASPSSSAASPGGGGGLTLDALQRHNHAVTKESETRPAVSPQAQSSPAAAKQAAPPVASQYAREGYLEKRTKGGKGKPHKRWFYMDKDAPVLRWRDSQTASSKSERRVQYSSVEICAADNGDGDRELVLELVQDEDESLNLICKDLEDRNAWYHALKHVVSTCDSEYGGIGDADRQSNMNDETGSVVSESARSTSSSVVQSKRKGSIFRRRQGSNASNPPSPSNTTGAAAASQPIEVTGAGADLVMDDISDDIVRCRLVVQRGCELSQHAKKGKGKPKRIQFHVDIDGKKLFIGGKKKFITITGVRQGIRDNVPNVSDDIESRSLTVSTFGESDTVYLECDSVLIMRAWLMAITALVSAEAGASLQEQNALRIHTAREEKRAQEEAAQREAEERLRRAEEEAREQERLAEEARLEAIRKEEEEARLKAEEEARVQAEAEALARAQARAEARALAKARAEIEAEAREEEEERAKAAAQNSKKLQQQQQNAAVSAEDGLPDRMQNLSVKESRSGSPPRAAAVNDPRDPSVLPTDWIAVQRFSEAGKGKLISQFVQFSLYSNGSAFLCTVAQDEKKKKTKSYVLDRWFDHVAGLQSIRRKAGLTPDEESRGFTLRFVGQSKPDDQVMFFIADSATDRDYAVKVLKFYAATSHG
eukprot:ANDGO_02970.mRNA.1 hypothetical protein